MISVSIRNSKDDIISYLRVRLRDDQASDAMDEALEAEILEMIPETDGGLVSAQGICRRTGTARSQQ